MARKDIGDKEAIIRYQRYMITRTNRAMLEYLIIHLANVYFCIIVVFLQQF